jgi:TIR domain
MPDESTNVFVSYSHADSLLVSPVVKLLRVNKSLVFQDFDTIQPGKRWRGEIAKGLAESRLVVVFWCTHASQSNEVSKEWRAAIEQKKDLLPLLLDPTPLPPELAEFQWIDFRGTVGANHSSTVRPVARMLPSRSARRASARRGSARSSAWRLLLIAGAAVLGILACLWLFLPPMAPPSGAPPTTPTPWPTPAVTVAPPPAKTFGLGLSPLLLYLLLGISLVLTVCLIWLLQPRWKAKMAMAPPASRKRQPGDIERYIASELEAEILRRTTLRRESGK